MNSDIPFICIITSRYHCVFPRTPASIKQHRESASQYTEGAFGTLLYPCSSTCGPLQDHAQGEGKSCPRWRSPSTRGLMLRRSRRLRALVTLQAELHVSVCVAGKWTTQIEMSYHLWRVLWVIIKTISWCTPTRDLRYQ